MKVYMVRVKCHSVILYNITVVNVSPFLDLLFMMCFMNNITEENNVI